MKRPFGMKEKAFFIKFKGVSIAKNVLRSGSAPLNISIIHADLVKLTF